MSLTSALARVELEHLADVVRDNATVVKDLSHVSTLQEDGVGGAFEKSLRVKGMIDALEAEAQRQPSWGMLAALVRSEYRLWALNAETPLRLNPFLSHWVEAVQRLETAAQPQRGQPATEGLSARDIAATRLETIKRMLRSDADAIALATPQQLYEARYPPTPFDVQPYVRMLEEEGIYEPSPAPPVSVTTTHDAPAPTGPRATPQTPTHAPQKSTPQNERRTQRPTLQEWKASVLSTLDQNPTLIFAQLTRLPIALPALEFLTNLVTNSTLATHNIDAKEVVLCFIQHALRLVEHMGQPPSINHQPPPQTDIGVAVDDAHGRDAQTRALRLLILFLKNLVRKGLVDVDPGEKHTLYYDLEGMYHSYMWMKEVREFKTLIEEGDTTDEG
ncbi:hypothetical protein C7974DRAFT_195423 [Boeremia exigua]|uniref:uncharacterized protein n=1 Tax=Boeremia exigua TaxID=749465 RepID=UPI001E8DB5E8|nr:uncharacterized protein C7974DRAFT_195423 [Boeremia exigua]KAH6625143.1 hypothetical protein C7974DRAFT_195423 [Boeremia exigua]